ncbi:branched-chain alpha-keto acid dehydrogenase E3 (dihydrolipoamide dehydrogenase) [Oceanobacillus iheyensis HTE831]|uniref:Dihydrolipoyl dehydrogenase n=1 Tax=Oceanobacillus iheyensis (strain DSM 14371 / CIP 107618 / JCM 11309 / KCTC 3954 / HTE831) TaxID=221109 RepID=Q8CXE6_OCEIH|nr:dihydrolipoyl dehydrogenase [Oceanobacillus iheyensis]BAC13823.1 branched-chain alpha-keto acid dehydrogenase E3 (dihydrolipoamide dehydrogenase) [Oceanobacillus iheyensis HTE831]
MATEYDLVILGGGTGGYVAAIRASQLKMKVAIVEKAELGGTCLHRGCIPSKALLRSAEVYQQTTRADEFGIQVAKPVLDFSKVQQRKQKIIDQLHQGVQGLMKKGKIDVYQGFGRILGPSIFSPMPGTISVEYSDGKENDMLLPKNVLIATGSRPNQLPGFEFDHNYILSSDDALALETLPDSIVIIGGGVIGIEWASMLNDFEVDVTILENQDRILSTEDAEISKEMSKLLSQKGINIITNANVKADSVKKDQGVSLQVDVDGEIQTHQAEKVLMSVGRKGNIENIGLENTDIVTDRNLIMTNEFYQTKESHIYAIGDVIGGLQLAHVASHEGIKAVEHMAGHTVEKIKANAIPSCIYSSPEAASIGLTEAQAKEKDYEVKVGKFPFKAVGKALVYGESEGFVKIVSDKNTNDLLGVHMIGPHVTDMIAEASLAKFLDATPWEISESIHPHPTLSEVIGEAALAVEGNQIHG